MRDEQVRQRVLLLKVAQQVQHLRADRHVQRADRLVGDDEFRLHHQRARNADALALTAGEFMGKAPGELGQQTHVAQCLTDLLRPLALSVAAVNALGHDVAHLGALVQRRHGILKDHLNLARQRAVERFGNLSADALAAVQDFALGGLTHADDGAADGGLSAAAFAHETEGLAAVNVKAHVVHRRERLAAAAEAHGQMPDFQQLFSHVPSTSFRRACE